MGSIAHLGVFLIMVQTGWNCAMIIGMKMAPRKKVPGTEERLLKAKLPGNGLPIHPELRSLGFLPGGALK